ncbi:hypothetical protein [Siminovitchia fortis]|uniref:hypothetical protein n=1 Tax=Siminovitchia fortis TaxID=254758 RepID=UPI0011A7C15A|nr:hypothetical protein [Siminovitchia fortis]
MLPCRKAARCIFKEDSHDAREISRFPTISQHRFTSLRVLSGCECHRLEVISQSLLKANYAFYSARLMLVADKQALSALPYPLSRQRYSSLYVDEQAIPLFLV